jgi:tetratricopeptide (TPR) repeat protein
MRKTPLLIVLLLASMFLTDAGAAGFLTQGQSVDSAYIKASLYEQDGNFEEASKLLEAVLESVDDEYIYVKLADIYSQLEDNEMVKFTLERAVRKLPQSYMLIGALADVYRMDEATIDKSFELFRKAYKLSGNPIYAEAEARAYSQKKDYNSAINIYGTLIDIDKKSDYYVQRARNFEKLGLQKEAIDDYRAAAELDGNFTAAAKLADYYMDQNNDTEAIKYLRMVLETSPDMTIAKFRIAVLLGKMGKRDEAENYFLSIVDVLNDTERLYVYKQLAKMALDEKDNEKAEEYFSLAYEINNDTQTAFSLALLAESVSELDTAKGWYEEILKNRPDFAEARKRLAIINIRQGNPDTALDTISQVEDVYKDVDYYRISAQALTDMKEFKKAETLLTEAVKLNPAEVKLYIDLALAVDKQGEKSRAADVIKSGMKYYPEDASLLNFLGYLYAEQGINLKEAEKMISKALKQKPQEAAYLDSMAWVFYQQGKYKDAFEYQKKALNLAPEEDEIRGHMEAIINKLGLEKSVDDFIQAK